MPLNVSCSSLSLFIGSVDALVFSLFPPLRGRAKRDGLLVGSAALEIALLLKLGAVMLLGVVSYKLLSYELPVRLIGWAMPRPCLACGARGICAARCRCLPFVGGVRRRDDRADGLASHSGIQIRQENPGRDRRFHSFKS